MVGRTVSDIADEDPRLTGVEDPRLTRVEDPRLIDVLKVKSVPEAITVVFGAFVALEIPLVIVADESRLVLDTRILEIILADGIGLEGNSVVELAVPGPDKVSVAGPTMEVTPEITDDNTSVEDAPVEGNVAGGIIPVLLKVGLRTLDEAPLKVLVGILDKADVT